MFLTHGAKKSSLKNAARVFKKETPLCGMGVFMDGVSATQMRSRSFYVVKQLEDKEIAKE